jgi:hypothetical protein
LPRLKLPTAHKGSFHAVYIFSHHRTRVIMAVQQLHAPASFHSPILGCSTDVARRIVSLAETIDIIDFLVD